MRSKYKLCFVGQVWEHQNIDRLADAMPLVKDADLIIVGEGPLLEALKRWYCALLFTGRVEQRIAADFVRYADVCVGPFTEGWYNKRIGRSALKLCEYLACGKPVVCSRTEGTEFIEKEGLGILVDNLEPETIASAVNTLLGYPELRLEMGRRARKYVVENRSWEKVAEQIAEVMEEAVAEKQSGT